MIAQCNLIPLCSREIRQISQWTPGLTKDACEKKQCFLLNGGNIRSTDRLKFLNF